MHQITIYRHCGVKIPLARCVSLDSYKAKCYADLFSFYNKNNWHYGTFWNCTAALIRNVLVYATEQEKHSINILDVLAVWNAPSKRVVAWLLALLYGRLYLVVLFISLDISVILAVHPHLFSITKFLTVSQFIYFLWWYIEWVM